MARDVTWRRIILTLCCAMLLICAANLLPYAFPGSSAVRPRPFGDPWFFIQKPRQWRAVEWRAELAQQILWVESSDPALVFIGDSLSKHWSREGKPVWDHYYVPRSALNLGVGGDRTENVLWRLRKMPLERLNPEAVVILAGVNNLEDDSPNETARGILAIVDYVRFCLPDSKILLLAIFPATYYPNGLRRQITLANDEIKSLVGDRDLVYLNIGDAFLDEKGRVQPELIGDGLHLTEAGYEKWAEAMEPSLSQWVGPLDPEYP